MINEYAISALNHHPIESAPWDEPACDCPRCGDPRCESERVCAVCRTEAMAVARDVVMPALAWARKILKGADYGRTQKHVRKEATTKERSRTARSAVAVVDGGRCGQADFVGTDQARQPSAMAHSGADGTVVVAGAIPVQGGSIYDLAVPGAIAALGLALGSLSVIARVIL